MIENTFKPKRNGEKMQKITLMRLNFCIGIAKSTQAGKLKIIKFRRYHIYSFGFYILEHVRLTPARISQSIQIGTTREDVLNFCNSVVQLN